MTFYTPTDYEYEIITKKITDIRKTKRIPYIILSIGCILLTIECFYIYTTQKDFSSLFLIFIFLILSIVFICRTAFLFIKIPNKSSFGCCKVRLHKPTKKFKSMGKYATYEKFAMVKSVEDDSEIDDYFLIDNEIFNMLNNNEEILKILVRQPNGKYLLCNE